MTGKEIADELKKLPTEELNKLIGMFGGSEVYKDNSKDDFMMEHRFAKGLFCPCCGSKRAIKNGKRSDGRQTFLCQDCYGRFSSTTGTILRGSPKSLSVWKKFVESLMNGDSVRKSAEICNIDPTTSFKWRHKILDALQNMADSVVLSGIVEADETFFRVSYKGNRTMSGEKIPRESRHRGGCPKRGLSDEQVCVPCAVTRDGLSIAKATNSGKASADDIEKALGGRIKEGTILCTDEMNSYSGFAKKHKLDLHQSKGNKSRSGMFNIQRVNAYHSVLKQFLKKYNGVATKYLNSYLALNNIVNYSKETFLEKQNIFIDFVFCTNKTVRSRDASKRPILPWAA